MAIATQKAAVESTRSLKERIRALERQVAELEARDRERSDREQELTDFVENAVVGLHKVAGDGTILWANEADCALLGYTRDEYLGRNIADFHADRQALCNILERLQAGEALKEAPAVLRCKDGSLRHVLISSNAHFEDGKFVNTRCFTRDVTEQRRVEAALLDASIRLAAVVESSEDAILTVDLAGTITSWNRGAVSIYGYTPEEILGAPIHTLIPAELHDEEAAIMERLRAGERIEHYETVRVRKGGARVDISLTVSPVRDHLGNLVGISKVARDISRRKREERDIVESARRKDEFLAILSHELRNPLAPIRYALTLARQPNTTPAQRDRAEEVIARQVDHMGRLLDDLLDVSRIARGHVELHKKWLDLTSVVGASIDAARPLLDRKGHTLSLDLPREALRFEADPVRVTQVLSNLLNNAAKYTDHGGHIHLRAWREEGLVAISVKDDGIGMNEAMVPRLFQLFSQAHPAINRSEGGLGIGLALVKGFVEMHGGRVEARSGGPGCGSEFVVRFPIGHGPREAKAPPGELPRVSSRLRVLIADDNADSAETCAMLMQVWGHEVRVAHNGAEALKVAEEFQPQVALLDIGMPQLNGYQLAEAIRVRPWATRTVLIAVTGWGQEDDKEEASRAGFDHHLTKPVDPATLEPLLKVAGKTQRDRSTGDS